MSGIMHMQMRKSLEWKHSHKSNAKSEDPRPLNNISEVVSINCNNNLFCVANNVVASYFERFDFNISVLTLYVCVNVFICVCSSLWASRKEETVVFQTIEKYLLSHSRDDGIKTSIASFLFH